jgi:hypothetical protein
VGGDGDKTVLGREHAERAEQGMVVAFRHRHAAGVGMLVHDALAHRQDGVDHADIDELAPAGLVGAQDGADDADGAHGGGHQIADAGPDLHRRVLVRAGDGHDATERLSHDVVGRPVGVGASTGAPIAEAANGGVDQLGEALVQGLVAQAQAIHDAAAIILDHRVGAVAQPHHQLAALGALEVDGDRLLVAVHRGEVAAERPELVVGMVGADDPRVVAVERLDLDDLGALVGQQHGAEWAGQHLGEIDDADSIEGTVHGERGPPGPLMNADLEVRGPARVTCLPSGCAA